MGGIENTTGDDLRKQIALNFETAFYVTKPLFGHMMNNKKGNIVFISARPALNPAQGKDLIAYGLSKSLLLKLAEYLNEAAKGMKCFHFSGSSEYTRYAFESQIDTGRESRQPGEAH